MLRIPLCFRCRVHRRPGRSFRRAASEKQINFLNILLAKDYNHTVRDRYEAAIAEGKHINKWQAIELIGTLKTNDDYIYGSYPNISQNDFAELEERMDSIISMMK